MPETETTLVIGEQGADPQFERIGRLLQQIADAALCARDADTGESFHNNTGHLTVVVGQLVDETNSLYMRRPLCSCHVADTGTGETGPSLTIMEFSPTCEWPEHRGDLADHDLFDCSACHRTYDIEDSVQRSDGELICTACARDQGSGQ